MSIAMFYLKPNKPKLRLVLTGILSLIVTAPAFAADYRCEVRAKWNGEHFYSDTQLKKAQFSVLIEERGDTTFVSRCSYAHSAGKVTCDRYPVDKVAFDKFVKIKKYYNFFSHFDVQVFPNLSFVENNGRGDIARGKCKLVAP